MGGASRWLPTLLPTLAYGGLGLLGIGISQWHRGAVLSAPTGPRFAADPATALAIGTLLALVLVLLTVWSTRWLVVHARWARALERALRGVVLGVSPVRLQWLAISAALAEELLFRAALVPAVGVWTSALLFGALHFSTRATYLGWMLWATLMGVLLGSLFVLSGSLLPPILAHALINFANMRLLARLEPAARVRAEITAHPPRTRRV
jgi:uncharacterized protein